MFLPENIDLAQSEKYILSIRLTPDGFSFCIYSPDDPTIFHFQETSLGNKLSYVDNIKKLIFDLGFFSQAFHKTTVTTVSPHYTLVPDPFFDRKKVKELFQFNFHEPQGIVLSEVSSNGSYHIVFDMQEEVHAFLLRNLWNSTFHHHITSLLQLFETDPKAENQKTCFIDFHDKSASIICFTGEKLLSANTLPGVNPNDTTYYIASVWEKLNFSQTTDRLCLSGEIDAQNTVIDTLKRLIRNVEYMDFHPNVQLTEAQRKTLPTDILAELCV